MAAQRYWRAAGMAARGGGDVELFALHLAAVPVSDPHYASVAVLLHCEGPNDSTVFTDSSARPKTVTAYDGSKLSTANASAGASAMYFGSSAAHARVAPHADFAFGAGDFTVECWVCYSSHAGARPVSLFNGNEGVVQLYIASGSLAVETGDSAGGVGGSVPLNEWAHLAVARASGVVRSFVNGTKAYEYTDARSLAAPANININQYGDGGGYGGVGFVDEIRITKGVARYTADFTPSSAAYPDAASGGSIVRVDADATLSSVLPLVSGSLGALQDSNTLTVARFNPRPAGAGLVWDFGAGNSAEVNAAIVGSSASEAMFLSHFDLQGSADGINWGQAVRLGRFVWPGPNATTDAQEAIPAGLVRAVNLCVVASSPVPPHACGSASRVDLARDIEFGGAGTVYGTTKTKGTPNLPTKARVVLLHQRSKLPVRETWSDPVTGAFAFTGIDTNQQFLTLAEDAAGNFRPVAANRLTPEVLP